MHHLFFSLGEGGLDKRFRYEVTVALDVPASVVVAATEVEAACLAWRTSHQLDAGDLCFRPIFTERHSESLQSQLRQSLQQALAGPDGPGPAVGWQPILLSSQQLASGMDAVAEAVALTMRQGHKVSFGLTQGLRPFALGMVLGYALGIMAAPHALEEEGRAETTKGRASPLAQRHLGFAAFSLLATSEAERAAPTPCQDLAPMFHLLGLALGLESHQDGLGPELLVDEFRALLGQQRSSFFINKVGTQLPEWVSALESALGELSNAHLAALALDAPEWARAQGLLNERLRRQAQGAVEGHFVALEGAAQLVAACLKAEDSAKANAALTLVAQARQQERVAALVSWAYGPWDRKSPSYLGEQAPELSTARWALRNHVDHMGLGKPPEGDVASWIQQLDAWLSEHPTHPLPSSGVRSEPVASPGRRILLAPLGYAKEYRSLRHQSSQGKALGEGPFAFTASAALTGGAWDEFWVILPPSSQDTQLQGRWDEVLTACAAAGLPQPEVLLVPEREGTPWHLFATIQERLRPSDSLHIDLTHGYRHLPLAAWMVGAYLQASRLKGQVTGLSYVQAPAASSEGECLDLSSGLEALALSKALSAWHAWGRGEALAAWIKGKAQGLPLAAQEESAAWLALGEALAGIAPALRWALWGQMDAHWSKGMAALERLEGLQGRGALAMPWQALVLWGLRESLAPMGPTEGPGPIHLDPQRLARLARLTFQRRDWFTAALLAREAMVAHMALPLRLKADELLAFDDIVGAELARRTQAKQTAKEFIGASAELPSPEPEAGSLTLLPPWPEGWPKPSPSALDAFQKIANARNPVAHLNPLTGPKIKRDVLASALTEVLAVVLPKP